MDPGIELVNRSKKVVLLSVTTVALLNPNAVSMFENFEAVGKT